MLVQFTSQASYPDIVEYKYSQVSTVLKNRASGILLYAAIFYTLALLLLHQHSV